MIRYNDGNELVKLEVHDSTGRKIDRWVCRLNEKEFMRMVNNISKKYGFSLMFEMDITKFLQESLDFSELLK